MQKLTGVDVGFHGSCHHPADGEGCVGKRGLDKNLSLETVVGIAYRMEEKPNIIIKSGPRAKWYLKRVPMNMIEPAMQRQTWRDMSRCTMWIIHWDQQVAEQMHLFAIQWDQ
jgi:hypothetical protein